MSLFDENGESRAAGHGGGKMAARPRDPPRVWRSLGGAGLCGSAHERACRRRAESGPGRVCESPRPRLRPAGRRKTEAGRSLSRSHGDEGEGRPCAEGASEGRGCGRGPRAPTEPMAPDLAVPP